MLRAHRDEIEADLLRYFAVDVARDLGTERCTWRRFRVLLEALPAESRYSQAVGGPQVAWTFDQHLLVTLIDAGRELTYVTVQSRSRRRIARPKPLPRPTDRPKIGAGEGMSIAELQRVKALKYRPVGTPVQVTDETPPGR